MTSPVTFWEVSDIEAKLAEVTAAGGSVKEAAHDVGGGRLSPLSPTPTAMSLACSRIHELQTRRRARTQRETP